MLLATYVTFALAVACGAYLVAVAGPGLLAVGAASILAGVLYTGGPRPYGYEGLGEVFVFLFFGIVAVAGSYFVQVQHLPWQAFVCAVPVGLLASAILVVNNVRDLETDRRAGKRTLAVRLGRARTRTLYAAMVLARVRDGAAAVGVRLDERVAAAALAGAAAGAARWCEVVRSRTDGPALNGALAGTGALQLLFCLLFSAGILASGRRGLVKLELERRRARARARRCRPPTARSHERELIAVALTGEDGLTGYGEAAPLEPYDGVSVERVRARRWSATGRVLARPAATAGRAADRSVPQRRGPAAGARRDRPRAVGPRRAARGQGRWRRCSATSPRGGGGERDASRRSTVRAWPSRPPRAVRAGFECLKVKVGVGDDAGRVAAARAAAGPARRCAWTPTGPGTWSRR